MRHQMIIGVRGITVALLVALCSVAFLFNSCGSDVNEILKDGACVLYERAEREGDQWTDPQGIGNLKLNSPCLVYGNIHATGYQDEPGYITGTYLGDEDFYAVYTPDRDDLYLWIRITWETDSEFDMYIGEVSVIPGGFVSLTPQAMDPFFEEGSPASLCAKVTAFDEFVIIVGGRSGEPGDYTLEVMLFSGQDADNDGFYRMNYCGPGCDDTITCGDDCVDNLTELEAVGTEWLEEYGEMACALNPELVCVEDSDCVVGEDDYGPCNVPVDTIETFMADHDSSEFTPCPDAAHRRYYDGGEWVSPEERDHLDYNCSGGLTPADMSDLDVDLAGGELDRTGTPLVLDGDTIVAKGVLNKAPDEETGEVGDFEVVLFDLVTPPTMLPVDKRLNIHVEFCTDNWCPEGWNCQDEEVMIQFFEAVNATQFDLSGFKIVRGDTLNFSTLNPDYGQDNDFWYVGVGQWAPLLNCPDVPYEITISYVSKAVDADGDGYYNLATGGDDCDDSNPDIHPCNLEICGNGIDEDCSGEDWTCMAGVIDEIEPNDLKTNGDPELDENYDGVPDVKALLCSEAPGRDGCIPDPLASDPVTIRGNICQTGKTASGLFSLNTDAYYINLTDLEEIPFDWEIVLRFTLDWTGDGRFGYTILTGNGKPWLLGNAGPSPQEFSRTMTRWYDSAQGRYRADYIIIIGGTAGSPGDYTLELAAGEQGTGFCPDNDYDGYQTDECGGDDCDDTNRKIHPGAVEKCDGIDNACEGGLWAEEIDADGDGYGECDIDPLSDCYQDEDCLGDDPPEDCFILCDCDDADGEVYPGVSETCNGRDDNCDLNLPEAEGDDDGDGYVECTLDEESVPAEGICGGEDCDDDPTDDPSDCFGLDCQIGDCVIGNPCTHCSICINPGQSEKIWDGVDNDCDGLVDELW